MKPCSLMQPQSEPLARLSNFQGFGHEILLKQCWKSGCSAVTSIVFVLRREAHEAHGVLKSCNSVFYDGCVSSRIHHQRLEQHCVHESRETHYEPTACQCRKNVARAGKLHVRFVSSSRTLKELRLFDNHILKAWVPHCMV